MKISLLIDNSDSWFHDYIPQLRDILLKYDPDFIFIRDHGKIKRGDILFILSSDKILSKEKLALHRNNIVIHASNLPKDRGWSPVTWLVERGKNKIPITIFEASEKLDAGKYYFKDVIRLDGSELIDEIRGKLAAKIIQMIDRYLSGYPMHPFPQSGKPTYNRRRVRSDCQLNVSRSIRSQFNKMRIADNKRYPLFFKLKDKEYILKIYKS